MHWFKQLWLKAQQDHTEKLPEVKLILSPTKEIEKTIAELRLAIENDKFVFPEFSNVDKEEAKGLSMKALSITTRIFQLGMDHGDS